MDFAAGRGQRQASGLYPRYPAEAICCHIVSAGLTDRFNPARPVTMFSDRIVG